jgi:hypothetical protein
VLVCVQLSAVVGSFRVDDPNACVECTKEGRRTAAWYGYGCSVSEFGPTRTLTCILDARAVDQEWSCHLGHRLRGGPLSDRLWAACADVRNPA